MTDSSVGMNGIRVAQRLNSADAEGGPLE